MVCEIIKNRRNIVKERHLVNLYDFKFIFIFKIQILLNKFVFLKL